MDTTAIVLAEMVQQERMARKNYFNKLKAPQKEKQDALNELKKVESNIDNFIYSILHPLPNRRPVLSSNNYRGGVLTNH